MWVYMTMNMEEDLVVDLYQPPLFYSVVATYFASYCAMMCCFGRVVPINYILLGIFTWCVSYMLGIVCFVVGQEDKIIVFQAALMTAAMTSGLTVFALTEKSDFTVCAPFLWVITFTSLMFLLVSVISGWYMNTVYCYFGVILFSFYIVLDT